MGFLVSVLAMGGSQPPQVPKESRIYQKVKLPIRLTTKDLAVYQISLESTPASEWREPLASWTDTEKIVTLTNMANSYVEEKKESLSGMSFSSWLLMDLYQIRSGKKDLTESEIETIDCGIKKITPLLETHEVDYAKHPDVFRNYKEEDYSNCPIALSKAERQAIRIDFRAMKEISIMPDGEPKWEKCTTREHANYLLSGLVGWNQMHHVHINFGTWILLYQSSHLGLYSHPGAGEDNNRILMRLLKELKQLEAVLPHEDLLQGLSRGSY
jgi:hypothetical protein